MNYKEKIKLAEEAANAILNEHVSEDEMRDRLKEQGITGQNINNVMVSARKEIGEKIAPKLRGMLLEGIDPITQGEFSKLDPDLLERIVGDETKAITREEKKKVGKLLREGLSPEEIAQQINLKFYPESLIQMQAQTFEEINQRNSGSSRMLYIIGGLILIAAGVTVFFAVEARKIGKLAYALIAFGAITLFKGFTTVENPDMT